MRLSELLGRRVIDGSGRDLGRVHDVRLRGPGVASVQTALGSPAFRIDGLIIGTGGLADRLGFDRAGVRAPALVRVVALALLRHPVYIPWSRVTRLAQGQVEISGTGNDLEPPTVLTMERS
jgi:hypothetical protein